MGTALPKVGLPGRSCLLALHCLASGGVPPAGAACAAATLSALGTFDHYAKESLQYLNKDKPYNITEAYNNQGLKTKAVWYEAFDSAPQKQVKYIRRMRENGEQLNKEPRILLSTIHGVKGGEKENVVLLTDLSNNTQKNMDRFPDDENRLFYVGATRTKEHLHIIKPKDIYKSFRI